MPNSKVLFQDLIKRIHIREHNDEIESIVYMILEHETGATRSDVMAAREIMAYDKESLEKIVTRINMHEPVQYILGEADFFRRKFIVNSSVLIPRQETELLVSAVLKLDLPVSPKILDIGTGSGCIALTLALELARAELTATDISEDALKVAMKNANALGTTVQFLRHDILHDDIHGCFDVIVSNPPYISSQEKSDMNKNVVDYEPHLALFSENDPLLFYKNIAAKSRNVLNKNGTVLAEINEHFSKETLSVFQAAGFSTCKLVKDLQNKDRIIVAQ